MDVKNAFDYISKTQLITWMFKLKIDGNLIHWTRLFFTDWKLQLVINGYNNQEKEVETRIFQRSVVSLILILIYISGIFEQIKKKVLEIVLLLFVHNLGFIVSRVSIKKIAKTVEKVGKIAFE